MDKAVKEYGGWGKCTRLISIMSSLMPRSGGSYIFDVGANIGMCSVMFAVLGYKVVAFEPLPRNADLLEASLRLNGIGPVPLQLGRAQSSPPQLLAAPLLSAEAAAAGGAATLVRAALGDVAGRGHLCEDRVNAGNITLVLADSVGLCDNTTHMRHAKLCDVLRLDDLLSSGGTQIGLMKLDVQGAELRVLRGAVKLLRAKAVRLLYFEWRPMKARHSGEDPAAPLTFLHELGYLIVAPRYLFTLRPDDLDLAVVGREHFGPLLGWNGDLVAIAG